MNAIDLIGLKVGLVHEKILMSEFHGLAGRVVAVESGLAVVEFDDGRKLRLFEDQLEPERWDGLA